MTDPPTSAEMRTINEAVAAGWEITHTSRPLTPEAVAARRIAISREGRQ